MILSLSSATISAERFFVTSTLKRLWRSFAITWSTLKKLKSSVAQRIIGLGGNIPGSIGSDTCGGSWRHRKSEALLAGACRYFRHEAVCAQHSKNYDMRSCDTARIIS